METPRRIRLYGRLAELFGKEHRFVCNSTAEAIRALCAMIPGFEAELTSSKERGVAYFCFDGDRKVSVENLHGLLETKVIKIAPVIVGSGGNGLVGAILGVVLIASAFLTGGATLSASGLVFSGLAGQMAFGLGVAFLATGITQMVMPMDVGLSSTEGPENGTSYHMNGIVNRTAQGNPVPILYGRMMIGSCTVSAGLYSEDQL